MIAFGNAYFITDETSMCGGNSSGYEWTKYDEYNQTIRECFNTKCGRTDAKSDCFNGTLTCQHGAAECTTNLLQMCGKSVANGWSQSASFAVCMESKYATILSSVPEGIEPNMAVINLTVGECAEEAPIEKEAVLACFINDAKKTQKAAAKATPSHPGTPFVQITNKTGTFALDTSGKTTLLEAVCAAWQYNGGALKAAKGCTSVKDKVRALVI